MSNQWFRMYNEFASDPKVQTLSEAMQRRLIMLFCLESCGSLKDLTSEEIAFALRLDDVTLHETLQVFRQKGFIDENNHIQNWDKRQYKSDSSAERVKKFREKSKVNNNVTETKRYSNANVTPPEQNRTDTDTDKIKKKKDKKEKVTFESLSVEHVEEWLVKKRQEGRYQRHDAHEVLEKFKDYCLAKKVKYDDYVAAYRNAFDWDKCQPKTLKPDKHSGFEKRDYTGGSDGFTTV